MDIVVLIYILLIIAAAKVMGELVTRFNQPQIIGELLAGIVLGPFALGAIIPQLQGMYTDEFLQGIADLGILFLMIAVGLEFSPKTLLSASWLSLVIAVGGILIPLSLGLVTAILFGLSGTTAIFIALALSVTALPVTIRVLKDMEVVQTRTASRIIGAAVFTDVSLLFAMALILPKSGGSQSPLSDNLFFLAMGYILFFIIAIVVSRYFLPKLIKILRWMRSGEAAFGIAISIAILFAVLAYLAGLPEFIGAFIAGMIMREAGTSLKVWVRVEDILNGITLGFLAPIFFVLIGFSVNFSAVFLGGASVLLLFGAVLAIAVFGKLGGSFIPARLSGMSRNESMAVASMMMGKGAMELVFARLALEHGIIGQDLFSILVLMAFISTLLAPFMFRHYFNKACIACEIPKEKDGTTADAA